MCQGLAVLQCLTGKNVAESKVGQERYLQTRASHLGPWLLVVEVCVCHVFSLHQLAPSQELQSVLDEQMN